MIYEEDDCLSFFFFEQIRSSIYIQFIHDCSKMWYFSIVLTANYDLLKNNFFFSVSLYPIKE